MHHMFKAIRRVLDEHPECKAIYPIHMNPVVRQAAYDRCAVLKLPYDILKDYVLHMMPWRAMASAILGLTQL